VGLVRADGTVNSRRAHKKTKAAADFTDNTHAVGTDILRGCSYVFP